MQTTTMDLHPGLTTYDFFRRVRMGRESTETIILHPNGFLQLPLGSYEGQRGGKLRLHIWSEGIPARGDKRFSVHDHTFDIDSRILCGSLTDTRYDVREDRSGNHLIFQSDGTGQLVRTNTRVSCEPGNPQRFEAGTLYRIPVGEFHTSFPNDHLVATLIVKSNIVKNGRSRVVVPREYTGRGISVDRSIDQELAWQLVDAVCREIN